jgi:hypothetical protein
MVLARNRGQFREAGSSDVERLAVATAATNSACREIIGGSGGTPSATASVTCLVGSAQWAVQSGDVATAHVVMAATGSIHSHRRRHRTQVRGNRYLLAQQQDRQHRHQPAREATTQRFQTQTRHAHVPILLAKRIRALAGPAS